MRFAYFGVYLDLTNLSSRDLVLYGIEVLYLPVAVLLMAVLVLAGAYLLARHVGGRLRLIAAAAVTGLALTGLFWAGTSFAWRLGQGRAYDDALQLPNRPEVVLDTGERLIDLPPYVRESPLPTEPGGKFRYRYRGLRLLIQAGGRLFLVPEHWTAQGRTLIVPYDGAVRLQVIPRPGA